MAGNAINIAILADPGKAVAAFDEVGASAQDMSGKADDAGRHVGELGEKMGDNASRSSQFAGGIGDIGGALAQLPGPLGAVGSGMELLGPSLMGVVGAFDLMELAANSTALAWVRNAAASVASRVAMVAGAVATGVMTAAQWALNIALSANPVGLIIIALIALAAVFVLLWKKSETFRNIVTGAWNAIKAGAMFVFNFLKAYFVTMFTAYRAAFVAGINAVKSIWNGIVGLWTKVREFKDKVLGVFTGLFGKMKSIGSDIVRGIADGIQGGLRWVKEKIGALGSLLPDWLQSILGIHSPSRVMAEVGRQAALGVAVGFGSVSAKDIVSPLAKDLANTNLDAGTVALSADAVGGRAGGRVNNYNITVEVSPTADLPSIGRELTRAINAYERLGG